MNSSMVLSPATSSGSSGTGHPSGAAETPVRDFFDRHAEYYERSWDTREHGMHIGIFEPLSGGALDLESAFQRSRDQVRRLMDSISPISRHSRVLDVCCGTGATLAEVVRRFGCGGIGVDISSSQLERAERLRRIDGVNGDLSFRQGSASRIFEVMKDRAPITHAFSQEGLLFAQDKDSALRGLYDLLTPGGALVISDFVPLMSKDELEVGLRARVYEDVKWAEGLMFQQYLDLLKDVGFELVLAELRPLDMRMTYEALIPRTRALGEQGDPVYDFLANRYEGIVRAVTDGALSWAWFAARKS